jgi:Fe2+ or Zn2+ uptake regulation protein
MGALAERTDHPTVDQVFSDVIRDLPEVSRTTVYRALETLGRLGLVARVEHPGSAVRFDANMDPHHHFLCTSCGALTDLPLDSVRGCDALRYEPGGSESVDQIAILVRGTCAACLAGESRGGRS